ncbi:MAG: hypothetical protein RIS65_1777, partial [Pseudomonadota bacterium]
MHHRGVKMEKISKENVRRRQSFCLQGHFALISKPFWRPSDLTHIVHCCVGKLGLRTTKSGAYRLALNNMASN